MHFYANVGCQNTNLLIQLFSNKCFFSSLSAFLFVLPSLFLKIFLFCRCFRAVYGADFFIWAVQLCNLVVFIFFFFLLLCNFARSILICFARITTTRVNCKNTAFHGGSIFAILFFILAYCWHRAR